MKIRLAILLCLIVACGSCTFLFRTPKQISHTEIYPLQTKFELYVRLAKQELAKTGGWIPNCDSLTFMALCAWSSGCDTNLFEAEIEPGRWIRNPKIQCYPKIDYSENQADTDASIDAIMQVSLFLYSTQNVEAMRRLLTFGKEHKWLMGEGESLMERISRTWINPIQRSTLFDIWYKLTGEHNLVQYFPLLWYPALEGYRAHLQALHIFEKGLVNQKLNALHFGFLKVLAEREPNNAVYQAIYHYFGDGDQREAIRILGNEQWFPANRLPSSNDRCESYLFQRDQITKVVFGSVEECFDETHKDTFKSETCSKNQSAEFWNPDWLPCPDEGQTHIPVDFFVAWKILNS